MDPNIYQCCNVPLGGRFVGPFSSTLEMHSFGRSGSIWILPLLDARMESELSLRLHDKTIEFDNTGYFTPCIMNIVIADVMCYLYINTKKSTTCFS